MADDNTPSRLDSLIAKKHIILDRFCTLLSTFLKGICMEPGAFYHLGFFTSFAASSERKNGSGQAFSLLSQDCVTTATRIYTRLSLASTMSSGCSAIPDTLSAASSVRIFFYTSHINGASSVYQRHLFLLCIACTKHTRKFSRPRLFFFWVSGWSCWTLHSISPRILFSFFLLSFRLLVMHCLNCWILWSNKGRNGITGDDVG